MGGCGAGQQAPEAVGAVAGQFHLVGDFAEGGLDAFAPFGDDLLEDRRHLLALIFSGWDEHGGAAGGLLGGEGGAVEALVTEQVSRSRPGQEQVGGGIALVDRGGHDVTMLVLGMCWYRFGKRPRQGVAEPGMAVRRQHDHPGNIGVAANSPFSAGPKPAPARMPWRLAPA